MDRSYFSIINIFPKESLRQNLILYPNFFGKRESFALTSRMMYIHLTSCGIREVLSVLEEVAKSVDVQDKTVMRWSWNVMTEHGNLSGASNLAVLDCHNRDYRGPRAEWVICLSMGPGIPDTSATSFASRRTV